MRSVMQHQFSRVPRAEIQRSAFDRSHGNKGTFDAGYLVPVLVDEVLPGDSFNCRMSMFARLATPLKPIMDNMFLDSFFFFVPNRLIWENWERFNGAQDNPEDSTDYLVPRVEIAGGVSAGDLSDYFGLPIGTMMTVNSLWHRAYNLIWNEWFRDENLQDSVPVPKDDGPDDIADFVLLRRGKRHDYFTSCLPWPQKGPDITLPLGGTAPIDGTGDLTIPGLPNNAVDFLQDGSSVSVEAVGAAGGLQTGVSASGGSDPFTGVVDVPAQNIAFSDIASGLEADLTAATAATINGLREAFQLQRMLERDARGGTRYTEIVRSHFNVVSPDARLQRPEYLGGGSSPVNIHPVAQTSENVNGSPQGNLAAFGTAAFNGHGFTKSFTEHGVIIGLVCVRADLTYQQGINRMFNRRTRFDFFWPALAHLG